MTLGALLQQNLRELQAAYAMTSNSMSNRNFQKMVVMF